MSNTHRFDWDRVWMGQVHFLFFRFFWIFSIFGFGFYSFENVKGGFFSFISRAACFLLYERRLLSFISKSGFFLLYQGRLLFFYIKGGVFFHIKGGCFSFIWKAASFLLYQKAAYFLFWKYQWRHVMFWSIDGGLFLWNIHNSSSTFSILLIFRFGV